MKVITNRGWVGEIREADVVHIEVECGESLVVQPGEGKRAVVLLIDKDKSV